MDIESIISKAMQDSNFATILKARLEEVEQQRNWPQNGDTVYFVPDRYNVSTLSWSDEWDYCQKLREVGNIFANEEDAKHEALCRYYRDKYRAMGRPFFYKEPNWSAWYDLPSESIMYENDSEIFGEMAYFSTKEECKEAVESIGIDNFIHYVLGIKTHQ